MDIIRNAFLVLILAVFLFGCISPDGIVQHDTANNSVNATNRSMVEIKQIITPYFINSAPEHLEVFAQTPSKVVINTNFDLLNTSEMRVFLNKKEVSSPTTLVSENGLSMENGLDMNSGNGVYEVEYKACWLDNSCDSGKFQFFVNSSIISEYKDLTGMKNVTVDMKDIMFDPRNIIVSKGVTVTFINNEEDEHFVNSDPHPSHNYLSELNSLDLGLNDNYSYMFNEPGEFHYHCSAHANLDMEGRIIVMNDGLLDLSQLPEPSGDFCGSSTNGACSTDADCMTGGCSGQVCQSKDAKPSITTCEYRDCYDDTKYGVACGCISGKCGWAIPMNTTIDQTATANDTSMDALEEVDYAIDFNFIRAAHYVSSNPLHGTELSGTPGKIVINFNFVLHTSLSNIRVTHDKKIVGGDTSISANRLSMESPITDDGKGVYRVDYDACWPDGSCHNGVIGFIVE